MNPVLKSTLFVVKNSKKVKIDKENIKLLSKKLLKILKSPKWPAEVHFQSKNADYLLTYLIILGALNFCFWPNKWQTKYKNKIYSDYFSLSLRLKRMFEENKNNDLNYLRKISFSGFEKFLGKNCPLLEKRYEIFKSLIEILIKKYPQPTKFVLSANHSAKILLEKIYCELPYFDDISFYKTRKIYFLKKAQILIADIYGAFKGKDIGYFKDLNYLTCFPDYLLPKILTHYEILKYSKDLEEKIKNKKLIPAGSSEEVEIRANTVWAIEILKNYLNKLGLKIRSFELDWYLWNKAERLKSKLPHHLTKTIYY